MNDSITMSNPFDIRTAEAFFWEHGAWSHDSGKGETAAMGRARCARELAGAERWAKTQGLRFEWEEDDIDSSSFSDDPNPWMLWSCVCYDEHNEVVASVGGVDFGRDGDPRLDSLPYRRVIEALLAQEAHDSMGSDEDTGLETYSPIGYLAIVRNDIRQLRNGTAHPDPHVFQKTLERWERQITKIIGE